MKREVVFPGCELVRLEPHRDDRGSFTETWRAEWFPRFAPVQSNRSVSGRNVLRGLHVHLKQTDVWRFEDASGEARILLVDLRPWSDTYMERIGLMANSDSLLIIPPCIAHGFYAGNGIPDSGWTVLHYLVDRYHDPGDEHSVAWDSWGKWGIDDPVLSERDRLASPWPMCGALQHRIGEAVDRNL